MDKVNIIDLYVSHNKSTYEIAELLNTYPNKIRRILVSGGVILKSRSDAQKNSIDSGCSTHPTMGKKRSDTEKIKISAGVKKYWENMSDQLYEERITQAKARWDNMSSEQREIMFASAIRAIQIAGKEGSKLEKYIHNKLSEAGYFVETHKKNLIVNQNLEIDMYIPAIKTIIEIDGPSHFLPIWGEDRLKKQIKADFVKTGLILTKGMVIIRVKSLSDKTCLVDRENLTTSILNTLSGIQASFPSKTERFIEIEI